MPFARPIARLIWAYLLWFMRRPWIKALRRNAPNLLPPAKREAAWENIKAQDRWAMKHGRKILTFAVNIFLLSLFANGVYFGLMWAQETGALRPIESGQVP